MKTIIIFILIQIIIINSSANTNIISTNAKLYKYYKNDNLTLVEYNELTELLREPLDIQNEDLDVLVIHPDILSADIANINHIRANKIIKKQDIPTKIYNAIKPFIFFPDKNKIMSTIYTYKDFISDSISRVNPHTLNFLYKNKGLSFSFKGENNKENNIYLLNRRFKLKQNNLLIDIGNFKPHLKNKLSNSGIVISTKTMNDTTKYNSIKYPISNKANGGYLEYKLKNINFKGLFSISNSEHITKKNQWIVGESSYQYKDIAFNISANYSKAYSNLGNFIESISEGVSILYKKPNNSIRIETAIFNNSSATEIEVLHQKEKLEFCIKAYSSSKNYTLLTSKFNSIISKTTSIYPAIDDTIKFNYLFPGEKGISTYFAYKTKSNIILANLSAAEVFVQNLNKYKIQLEEHTKISEKIKSNSSWIGTFILENNESEFYSSFRNIIEYNLNYKINYNLLSSYKYSNNSSNFNFIASTVLIYNNLYTDFSLGCKIQKFEVLKNSTFIAISESAKIGENGFIDFSIVIHNSNQLFNSKDDKIEISAGAYFL